ncbi:uncharacterized protein DEA37_0007126 [Paragonimus westermani]|uniref:Uncharacterized protein n=1 Tax=Paragonimus westermani TaxID=34504 RepID=A0A5J4P1G0_9TREM|nr:uncharacterized protein DEA37_0007126 [Paragonimus westermani]
MHYISANGQIDYSVLLRSLYWCSTVHLSARACSQLLRCVSALFDFGILDNGIKTQRTPHFVPRRPFNVHKMYKKLRGFTKSATKYKRSSPVSAPKKESISFLGQDDRSTTETYRLPGRQHERISGRRVSAVIYLESEDSDDEDYGKLSGTTRCTRNAINKQQQSDMKSKSATSPEFDSKATRNVSSMPSTLLTPRSPTETKLKRLSAQPDGTSQILSNNLRSRRQRLKTNGRHFVPHHRSCAIQTPQHLQQTILNEQTMKTNYALVMKIVIRVIRALGCRYGHHGSPTFGAREMIATDVNKVRSDKESTEARQLAQDCLYHLYETDCGLFARILSRLIATMCVADLMEMFHSLTGFCLDPAAHNTNQMGRPTSQSNYSNSFGQPTSGYGIRGAEGIVVACALGPFIRRLVRCRAELISQENVSLFGDVRQLFTYFREVHGSTFRRNMLVAMMCPIHRALERPRPKTQMNWSRIFGQPTSGYGIRGAEGIVVACALGPFIRRLVRCRAELISQENVSLFGDVRQLFTYFREVHGSTFRRNMLVAMMCPIHRALERPRPKTQMNWSRM